MSQQPLISVIVPVYNVERYLDQCMQSIVGQTYSNLEILVVDDGSTDNSGTMCDRWAERDRRIRVFHRPNGGLSAARNTALDAMTGTLVMMADSDDVLHLDSARALTEILLEQQADIAVGGYDTFVDDLPAWPAIIEKQPLRFYDQHEALLAVFYQQELHHSAWGRIYRASLFDDIRYPEGKLYEDLAIIYPLLKKCQRVVMVDSPVYAYRRRPNSILEHFSPRRADVLDTCEQLERETQQNDPQYHRAVMSRLLSAYFNILLLSNQDKFDDHKELKDRCWNGIKRLRKACLCDPHVRTKNKLGILASYPGRWFLCSVLGHRYQPRS